jgi:DNA-binding GntR family transcriptional regulator
MSKNTNIVPTVQVASSLGEAGAPGVVSAQSVVQFLKQRILSGLLVPGQRLVEPDVMRDTRASRGRVREALLRLSADGLVELHEFRGAVVKRLTRAEVRQAYDMREMLEGLAARLTAAAGLDELGKENLMALQAELDAATDSASGDRFIRANEAFHAFAIHHARNHYLAGALERVRVPIFRLQFHVFYTGKTMRLSNQDHQIITAAILRGDADQAERAMRAHVRAGRQTVLDLADSYFAAN